MKITLWKIPASILAVILTAGLLFLFTGCTEPPIAGLTADKAVILSGESVQFSDLSTGEIASWLWDFGDGTTSAEQNPAHVFEKNGDFTVTLTISNKGGESAAQTNVRVLQAPVAGLAVSKNKALSGERVDFTNSSTGDIASYLWDFGDGTTSKECNASHVYSDKGNFAVSLTVSNELSSDTETAQVGVISPVKANFSASRTVVKTLDQVQFTDNSTGDITSYSWDFGDLTANTTEQNPSHMYRRTGDFPVSLTVSNELSSDTKTLQVQVLSRPRASFSATPEKARAGEEIQFTDESLGEIDTWLWDFGDGNTSTEKNPTHTYAKDGFYTVTLEVGNPVGSDSAVEENYITVASLNLKLVICSKVTAAGDYTAEPDAIFGEDDPILVYMEVRGFEQREVAGGFESWVRIQSVIVTPLDRSSGYNMSYNIGPLSESHETSPYMAAFYASAVDVGIVFVSGIPGEYKVTVIVVDKLSGNIGVESTLFTVK